jgi:hypothetical protein
VGWTELFWVEPNVLARSLFADVGGSPLDTLMEILIMKLLCNVEHLINCLLVFGFRIFFSHVTNANWQHWTSYDTRLMLMEILLVEKLVAIEQLLLNLLLKHGYYKKVLNNSN